MKTLLYALTLPLLLVFGCASDDTSNDASDAASAGESRDAERASAAPGLSPDSERAEGSGGDTSDGPDVEMARDDASEESSASRVDLSWPVAEDGPYQAGHRTLELTYESVATGHARTLEVHLWYPTEATSGDSVFYAEIFADEAVFGNAPLAAPAVGDTYPLHIHSHGNLGYPGSSPHLMRHFATHGWVVVAPSHKGNTIMDNLSPRPAWMYMVRHEDISATLDYLGALPEGEPLAGHLDVSEVLLSGHSYGAYTTLGLSGAQHDMDQIPGVCETDASGECSDELIALFETGLAEPRVVASIPMAPGSYAMYGEGIAEVAIPVMHMTGSDDRPEANEDIWAALPAPAVRVHVEGGCHQLFALGGCDLIDDDPGLTIINAYALAFGRQALLEDEGVSGLLDGSEDFDPAVTFSVK